MNVRRLIQIIACTWALGVCVAPCVDAEARPGGGHSYSSSRSSSSPSYSSSRSSSSRSYSSSSSSYSGSGSSGSGDLTGFEFILVLVWLGISGLYYLLKQQSDWSSGDVDHVTYGTPNRVWEPLPKVPRKDVFATLRRRDPNFSSIILGDFVYELYTRSLEARGSSEQLEQLSAYLSPQVRNELHHRGDRRPEGVEGVVIGSVHHQKLQSANGYDYLTVAFESNYSEVFAGKQPGTQPYKIGFYARERWVLVRKQGVMSRAPAVARALNCPSCGAPVAESQHDRCEYCGVTHGSADFDWLVQKIVVETEETRGPTLTGYAPEVGTRDRTIIDSDRAKALKALQTRDPEFSLNALTTRVRLIYEQLNAAWTSLQWDDARPYLSDRLWFSMRYWIHAYRDQGLQNLMLNAKTGIIETVKVEGDPFYDSVVVRVFATAIDQTIHLESGTVVGGSEQPRTYSEYWTLIRSKPEKQAAFVGKNCPSCGAALQINLAGNCDHCGVKVTGGHFDWVLSTIEQDESYTG